MLAGKFGRSLCHGMCASDLRGCTSDVAWIMGISGSCEDSKHASELIARAHFILRSWTICEGWSVFPTARLMRRPGRSLLDASLVPIAPKTDY